ncbi:hypothetical protein CP556_12435 [Natrinema sp. CBA1119]|uniref:hypothetical protein n=1 Tax=Natrinema sp. CBA1119 TaxID=1608465 RepID=UPI000BF31F42|nr:hypothetical protein [Natrinema sp. CBA1119]PGF16846.1 hypothetical protein CP556_12435 [Natrinema sp. CBA1119]
MRIGCAAAGNRGHYAASPDAADSGVRREAAGDERKRGEDGGESEWWRAESGSPKAESKPAGGTDRPARGVIAR